MCADVQVGRGTQANLQNADVLPSSSWSLEEQLFLSASVHLQQLTWNTEASELQLTRGESRHPDINATVMYLT